MDSIYIVLIVAVAFLILQRMLPAKGVRQMTTAELKGEINDKGKQFVDVRTSAEYRSNHIKGFMNIPLNELSSAAAAKLSKDKEVVVICQSGIRSTKASKLLKKLGYQQVTNVKGGMSAWS